MDIPAIKDIKRVLAVVDFVENGLGGTLSLVHAYGQSPLSGVYPEEAFEAHEAAFNRIVAEFDLDKGRSLYPIFCPVPRSVNQKETFALTSSLPGRYHEIC